MSNQPLLDSLDSVISQLEDLPLAVASTGVEVPAEQASSSDSFELVDSPSLPAELPVPASGGSLPEATTTSLTVWTPAWDQAILAANTPESLLALDLTPLRSLEEGCRLRRVGVWTSFGRLARAFQCGRAAHEAIHQGHLRVPAVQTPPVLLRDTVFVCLCCPRKPAGFWTTTKRSYTSLTGDYSGRGLRRELPGLVGFSFPSQSEAAAFLLGAEAAWPPRVQ